MLKLQKNLLLVLSVRYHLLPSSHPKAASCVFACGLEVVMGGWGWGLGGGQVHSRKPPQAIKQGAVNLLHIVAP